MTDLLNRQQFVLDELITWFQENYDEEQRDAVEGKETLFPDISINLLKLPSSQGIVGEKSFVASR